MLETRTVVEAQVCRIKTVHLSPTPSWREDLAKGAPLRAEYLLTVELQHGGQVLQALYRIPTQVADDGLSVTPLGIESGTLDSAGRHHEEEGGSPPPYPGRLPLMRRGSRSSRTRSRGR